MALTLVPKEKFLRIKYKTTVIKAKIICNANIAFQPTCVTRNTEEKSNGIVVITAINREKSTNFSFSLKITIESSGNLKNFIPKSLLIYINYYTHLSLT
jgi:hypothetical protein